ncbi:MAG: hypothetical protein ACRDFS_04100, partial [Chloroflexota bacterium]
MDPAFHNNLPVAEGVLELPGNWPLHHGGRLPAVRIAWRHTGAQDAPVVCALGGIWCDRFLFDPQDAQRGCWREIVGPGRALDASRYRILSLDYLGGRGESTGPQAGAPFPSISTYDQAEALGRRKGPTSAPISGHSQRTRG